MNKQTKLGIIVLAVLFGLMAFLVVVLVDPAFAFGEDCNAWILCKSYVNLRTKPSLSAPTCGRLDVGEGFLTDGESRNGFLHVLDAGECDCWVYEGYVSNGVPEKVDEYYVVVAKQQVICRKYVDGPRISGRRGWMKNGSRVKVYWISGDWALTARGYIKSEWLEVDPE